MFEVEVRSMCGHASLMMMMMMERGVCVGSSGGVFFSVWTVQYPMFVNIQNILLLHFISLCLSGVTTRNEGNDRSISYFSALVH
jgi:hypothetical protein